MIAASFLPEVDHEISQTRKLLSAIPEDQLDFRPHEKSMSLGALAGHVAEMVGWGTTTIELDNLSLDGFVPTKFESKAQILELFEKGAAEFPPVLATASDEAMMATWTMTSKGAIFLSMPRVAVIRGLILNHIVHHRGQLTVYLRLLGVPVPGMYGPSADEMPG